MSAALCNRERPGHAPAFLLPCAAANAEHARGGSAAHGGRFPYCAGAPSFTPRRARA